MFMTKKKPNHLIKANSPYLIQHAYNPVDWHPWGEDALNIAREDNKLLVISIGYAACHWCHVMEHESFENDEVAGVMNQRYVSVKVDREERPDIDHIYMAAAYASSGRGGWPLNVIALPDQQPIFAGTYYSKHDWLYILKYFADLYQSQPEDLAHQAAEIGKGMKRQFQIPSSVDSPPMDKSFLNDIYTTWEKDLDLINGGMYGAPKFPMPANLDYLLRFGARYQNKQALYYVSLTLDKISMGGIYDHLGGGFSRYSVDAHWHVPHFEKMLYDNAQLISIYSKAYAVFTKSTYKRIVCESIAFIERELTNSEGLFFASLDADSDGTEGAFYAWTIDEISIYLEQDPGLFLEYFSCEENGNWEHNLNVLRKSGQDEEFAKLHGISTDRLTAFIDDSRNQLLTFRSKRTRPATDDKILTCWNSLMISALTDAAKVFNQPAWLKRAITAANFYRANLSKRNGKLWRNSKSDSFSIAGFLDDYCFLIKSFLDIHQSTLDEAWLTSAEMLTCEVILHFTASDGIFFNLSSDEEPRLIRESIELSDNVIPASNSQMARNLFVLGHLLGNEGYLLRSEKMLKGIVPQIKRNPAFHANWTSLLADLITGPTVLSIVGDEKLLHMEEFSGHYLPGVIFSGNYGKSFPTNTKPIGIKGKTLIFICHDKTCYNPVETVDDALKILKEL